MQIHEYQDAVTDCRSIGNICELLFARNILAAARTYFTLGAIKSWCTTAVESVHSVCTGPVVLTGMTCASINTCFKGKDEKENYTVIYAIYERTCRISNNTRASLYLPFYHHEICYVLPLKSLRLVTHYHETKGTTELP